MVSRSCSGDPLDQSWQYIGERPSLEEEAEEVVYASDPEPEGEDTTENVPVPRERPDVAGQSTLEDWGWSDVN